MPTPKPNPNCKYFKMFVKNQPVQTIGPFSSKAQARTWAENRMNKNGKRRFFHEPIFYTKIIELA